MKNNKNIAEYSHFKRIYDPKIIERIINIDTDPKRVTQNGICELCRLLEIDIDCKELYEHFII